MANRKEKVTEPTVKVQYTIQDFADEIYNDFQAVDDSSAQENPQQREITQKLKLLEIILGIGLPLFNFEKDNSEEIRASIMTKVDISALSGFSFFLSSNRNFNYSWNYLRKQADGYVDFLFHAYRFICGMIGEVNELYPILVEYEDVHVVFGNLFDFYFNVTKPFITTNVLWDNIYQMTKINKEYSVSAKLKDAIILTTKYNYYNTPNNFVENVVELLKVRMSVNKN